VQRCRGGAEQVQVLISCRGGPESRGSADQLQVQRCRGGVYQVQIQRWPRGSVGAGAGCAEVQVIFRCIIVGR
jgi:hypothetical protein